ncbi:MAG: GAF domain-containing protein, partial [Candidatus Woesearchaeota archaeon]
MAAPSKSSQPKHNPTYAKPSKIKASSASSSSHAVPSSSQASSKAAASLSAKQTPSHALLQTSGGSSTAVIDTLPLHQTILDNIQTLVFVLDAHKTILWANRKARQIFKKTILGKPCHEVLYHYHQACKACEQMRSRAVSLAQATRRKAPIPCTAHTTTLGQYEIIELLLPKKTSSLPTPSLSHNSQQLQALIALSQKATVLSNDTAILEMVCSTLTKKMGYRFALVFLFPEKPEEKGVFSYSAQAIQHRVFERWFSTFQHQLLTHPFFEQLHKGTQQLQVPLSTFFTQFDLPPSVLSPSISPSQLQGTVVLTLLKTKVGKKGVLCTVNKSSTPDDLVLASTVATLVANALQNVYYQHSLKQKLLDLEQLHKLSQNMTTTSQFALMKQILDLAIEKTKAVSGSIMILNHDEKKLETIYARGRGIRKNFSEITFPVGVGAAGIVAKTGERLIIENKLTDDRYINVGSKTWTKNAYIGIPLKFKKSVLGVLNIDFRSKDDLSKDVLTYLTIISNTASVIIRNNQLYNHYVLRVKRLSVMYDIAKAIAATLDFEQVLDLIVKRIAQLMDTTLCSIFLVDQNKKELVLKSFYPSSIQLMEEVSIPIASTVSG